MATAAARTRPTRLVLWALVVGLVFGVVAMHHVASHHGAANPGHSMSGEHAVTHDSEPAAGAGAAATVPASASEDRAGLDGPTTAHVGGEPVSGPALDAHTPAPTHDDMLHLCMAILGGLLLFGLGLAMLRGRRFEPSFGTTLQRGRGTRDRPPPLPVPVRLAQLQVLRL